MWGLAKINGETAFLKSPTEIKLIGINGDVINEEITNVTGSVHFGVVKTVTGRVFLIGNYPEINSNVPFTNEIALPRPVIDVCCGGDRILFTM